MCWLSRRGRTHPRRTFATLPWYALGAARSGGPDLRQVVMNNFGDSREMQLCTTMFQKLFPVINVQKVHITRYLSAIAAF